MTRFLITGLAALFLCADAGAVTFDAKQSRWITMRVGQILDLHHFLHRPLNDEVSKMQLGFLIDRLDYYHMFFLQSDVDGFRAKYETTLDDAVLDGRSNAGYEIFNRFRQRLNETTNRIERLLGGEFDFTKEERFTVDRHEAKWPADQAEADELWRKRIKYELLGGRLNGDREDKIKDLIRKRYSRTARDYGKFSSSEILELYLGALGRAFDPHSSYMAPEAAENFDIHNVSMQLTGIGAVLSESDGYTKIVSLSPGGPAAKGGVLGPDDRILAVAQGDAEPVDVIDMKLGDVVQLIRGPKGTEVRLTVIPADADDAERKVISIIRDVIKIEEQLARAYLIEQPGANGGTNRFGLIDLPGFYKDCSKDVAGLIERLKSERIQGLMLDLRRNGGGLLDQAVEMAGLFVKKGPIVQIKDFQGKVVKLDDEDEQIAYDGPLIVMVGKHSASASEIVAGALQDYGRAVVVGDIHTHGKGTVQTLLDVTRQLPPDVVKDAGQLKFTIQKFYRVAGNSTQKDGVTPDIILPSVLNVLETGEAYLPNVMASDKITPANIERVNLVTPYLGRLRIASSARIGSDQDFKYIAEDIETVKKQQQDKSISLNEAERRADKKKQKTKADARKEERKARPPSGEQVTMFIWQKREGKERIERVTKPAPEAEEEEEPAEGDEEEDEKAKARSRKARSGEEEQTVPPILKDPHLREATAILHDYTDLAQKTWLAAKTKEKK
jgi:carboxyl-terminal processing protease